MPIKLVKYLKEELKKIDLTEILDIFLFGSAVKGKEFPKDIDLCIIFRKKVDDKTLISMEKRLKNLNVHLSSLVADNFFRKSHSLVKALLVEGISIFNGKSFINNFGFFSKILYSYDLSNLAASKKVRFVYLMKGRKEKGMVEKIGGEWMTDSCFIIPIIKDSEILSILKKWQINYKRKEILIH